MAAIHLLLEAGTRVVLPPPYLCCGFPAHVNAKTDQHARMVLRNSINFSQIRGMLAHLEIDACVVTCGTCMEGLEAMDVRKLFGDRIVDVAAYVAQRGLRVDNKTGLRVDNKTGLRLDNPAGHLYHTPCHDSLGGKAAGVLKQLGVAGHLETVPHCCSEAGTLALSRPDITGAMLHRKREALAEVMEDRDHATILTNCPSCLQGLGRNRDLGLTAKHIAVALAESLSGPDWRDRFRVQARRATAFTF
jgi:D-lactate dehydrogenase (cytochrome)